jgi:hypothetical protein
MELLSFMIESNDYILNLIAPCRLDSSVTFINAVILTRATHLEVLLLNRAKSFTITFPHRLILIDE